MDRLEHGWRGSWRRRRRPAAFPKAVKRFTTWAPLLIPFYIPRGKRLGLRLERRPRRSSARRARRTARHARSRCRRRAGARPGRRGRSRHGGFRAGSVGCVIASGDPRRPGRLSNTEYEVTLQRRRRGAQPVHASAAMTSAGGRTTCSTRPGGRSFVVDATKSPRRPPRAWPVIGNFPAELAGASAARAGRTRRLRSATTSDGLRTTVDDQPAGCRAIRWSSGRSRSRTCRTGRGGSRSCRTWSGSSTGPMPTGDTRSTTGCSPRWSTSSGLHAVLAWDKHSKAMGILAADVAPEGFLTSRVDFIGRARSLWTPRVLETLAFSAARGHRGAPDLRPDRQPAPGHEPAGATDRRSVRLLIGLVRDKAQAIDLVARHLGIPDAAAVVPARTAEDVPPDRAWRGPAGDAPALLRVLRGRPDAAGPHAVHAAPYRPHAVQRAWGMSSR